MIQTDPMIKEANPVEPMPLKSPIEPSINHKDELLPPPVNETVAAISLPQPLDIDDDNRDWSDSHLYHYIKQVHSALLHKKGVIAKEPTTPKSQRGMTAK